MDAYITIDTLYLHLKYPKRDVFDHWYKPVQYTDTRVLKNGCVVDNLVVKTGSSGYKISIWDHDARIYLTDQVDEKCGEGNGMGAWIQLGPKFIIQHLGDLQGAVNRFIRSIGIIREYPLSITRIDIAVDLIGVSMRDQSINKWSEDWVGRSKLSGTHFNSRSGWLETIYIGSRYSPVFLRIYDKVAQATKEGDFLYWFDVWNVNDKPVTRVEWEVKPKKGNFSNDLIDFSLFNGFSVRELLNYLMDWGRLCDPIPTDSNNRRWPDSKFWSDLRGFIEIWREKITWPTSRHGKEFHGISPGYLKYVSGTLSSAMARLSEDDPNYLSLCEELNRRGESMESIHRKAKMTSSSLQEVMKTWSRMKSS